MMLEDHLVQQVVLDANFEAWLAFLQKGRKVSLRNGIKKVLGFGIAQSGQ